MTARADQSVAAIEPAQAVVEFLRCLVAQPGIAPGDQALAAVAEDYRPNQLTQYLFETANVLSTFYEQCPVLKADDEATRTSRLQLVDLTGRVIERGLSLLGIRAAEKM